MEECLRPAALIRLPWCCLSRRVLAVVITPARK
jgi:hypothetical protein